jgi:putative dimethyl sulfoxide reductase chaperone
MTTGMDIELVALSRLLALAFAPPDDEALVELELLARGLHELAGGRDPDLAELARLAAEVRAADLAGEYERLFDADAPCPPYEGSYEADPFRQTRQMADVAGFYRAFGARADGERPDHAACELEFLSFLVAMRLAAEERGAAEDAAICVEAENAFLGDHLVRWIPTFCRRVGETTSSPFYASVACLGDRLATSELTRRGLEPEPLGARRRSTVEVDVLECGATAAAPEGAP